MPYRTEWIEPELILRESGINVYRAYKDDDYSSPLNYWYAIYPENDPAAEDEAYEFDVRTLGQKTADHSVAIRNAIRLGKLHTTGAKR